MENLNVLDPVAGLVLANTQRTVGMVIVVLLAVGGVVLIWFNTRAARPELGAEIELAANRKPYHADEVLEGKVLDRVLLMALVLIGLIAIGLPLYALAEPGRQSNAIEYFESDTGVFANRGAGLFGPSADGGLGCADCHGAAGGGGSRSHILLDADGEFVAQVNWQAPALNAVTLRYSDDEIRDILNYGRPGTPMAAWGTPGGGPLTTQQVDNLIDFLHSIEVDQAGLQESISEEVDRSIADGEFASVGEAIFNYGLYSSADAGTYSCGRCHTSGWSYGDPVDPGSGGTTGFSLKGGATLTRFPTAEEHAEFVTLGSDEGEGYGVGGQGSGRMPAFGAYYTEDQISEVVDYERGL
jgi:mono/diheme cytochrome c family protein